MNALPQFRVELDGMPVHFVHVRGVGPAPVPIVLTRGWPWTSWDFRDATGARSSPRSAGTRMPTT
jgi:hypothetical protein